MELKHVVGAAEGLALEGLLMGSASEALSQMDLKGYDTELRQAGIARVRQIALAFSGKHFQLQYKMKSISLKF